jgi:hypothetical protein
MNYLVNRRAGIFCYRTPIRTGLSFVSGFALLTLLATSTVLAAPPRITRLLVRGLQTDGTTRVSVQGAELIGEPKLLVDLPITSQKVVGTPKANTVDFDVTLGKDVTPGVYHLRLTTSEGITAPEVIAVDHLPQRPTPAANAEPEKLPTAVHGVVTGSNVQEIRFAGRKGDAITIDVMARRLGSKLRPVVHLYDSKRQQIAWSLPSTALAGDCRVNVSLPADDTYTVAIHDLTYAAATPGHFRVAIGSFDYVDQIFPAVVSRSGSTPLELIGHFGKQTVAKLDATAAAKSVNGAGDAVLGDWRPVAWPLGTSAVGLRPRLQVSDLNELVEGHTLGADRQLPALPLAVNGCLSAVGEEDVYHVAVAEGDKLRCELFAERLGSSIDGALELRNDKGARLVANDDTVGADPRVEYTVAKGVTKVTIAVVDSLRRGDASSVYRLVVTKADATATTADFRLTLFDDTLHLAQDGSRVLRVEADRQGYEGPIRLLVDRLPPGFISPATEIPAGANGALVVIQRQGDAKQASPGRVVVRGESVGTKPIVVRAASLATSPIGDLQPWLSYDVAVAPLSTVQPLKMTWDKEDEKNLYLGLDRKLTVRFERQPGAIGPLRLSLVTSQVPPLLNRQPNANLTIRGNAATVDVPLEAPVRTANDAVVAAEKALADLMKVKPKEADAAKHAEAIKTATTKRDEAIKKLREAEAKQKGTAEYVVIVPGDLKPSDFDLAIKAELRSLDNQTVVAEAFTQPLRVAGRAPLEIAMTPEKDSTITLDAKAGATVALVGDVKRLGGFAGDVTLTLAGLPAGVAVPRQVLKPKEDKYRLEYKLPQTFAAERVEGVQIVATMIPDSRRANITAKLEVPVAPLIVKKAK